MRIIPVVLYVIFLVGCANIQMYEGARLDSNQVAIIKPASPKIFDPQLAFVEMNGKAIPRSITWDVPSYEVPPGKQTITAALYSTTGNVIEHLLRDKPIPNIISFDAEAGKTYIVYYEWRNRNESDWILFVKEENSGRVVSEQ